MDHSRKRSDNDSQLSRKRQKQTSSNELDTETLLTTDSTTLVERRPKSRKELRKERKASQKETRASVDRISASNSNDNIHSSSKTPAEKVKAEANETFSQGSSNPKTGEEIRRLAKAERLKERRREFRKERKVAIEMAIQERQEAQERLRQNTTTTTTTTTDATSTKDGISAVNSTKEKRQSNKKSATTSIKTIKSETTRSKKKDKKSRHDQDFDYDVFSSVFHGSREDPDGYTSLRLGVKYKDIKIGKGAIADGNNNLVNVKYKLTGGKFNAVLDSSNNFTFRVGKGEVIQGWDIGLVGMREGGTRKLIVPPKAGYGSQDIGAGSGAILFFDITLLSVR